MNPDEITAAMSSLTDQQGAQDELKRALEKVQQGPGSPEDLQQLQIAMQKWSMAIQIQSQIIQQVNDSLKNIINKMG
jgi:type III secretion apparatus needle protein